MTIKLLLQGNLLKVKKLSGIAHLTRGKTVSASVENSVFKPRFKNSNLKII